MNRNTIYKALITSDCNSQWIWDYDTKFLSFEKPKEWSWTCIKFNNSTINDWKSIWLCRSWMIVKGDGYGFDIRLKFSDIDSIEIIGGEE